MGSFRILAEEDEKREIERFAEKVCRTIYAELEGLKRLHKALVGGVCGDVGRG